MAPEGDPEGELRRRLLVNKINNDFVIRDQTLNKQNKPDEF